MALLLSTAYFAPIQYYSKLCLGKEIVLERYEHYPRQTYRNRCVIYGANGPLALTVPVLKGEGLKIYTKDICIDYSTNWQKNHFKAIESAYRCSPYYEYYVDEFLPFFSKQYTFLFDFNLEILAKTTSIIGVFSDVSCTDKFNASESTGMLDYRFCLQPKAHKSNVDPHFVPPVYRQVFEPKSGFIGNLSILDLLFNTGPDAKDFLMKSIRM